MDGVDKEVDGHGEVLEGPGGAVRPVDKARRTRSTLILRRFEVLLHEDRGAGRPDLRRSSS